MRNVPALDGYMTSTEVMAETGLSRLGLLGLEESGLLAGHRPKGAGRGKAVYFSLASVSAIEAARVAVEQAITDWQNANPTDLTADDSATDETASDGDSDGADTVDGSDTDVADATGAEFGDVVAA